MTNEELNEAIRYLEEEKLIVEAILYGENQDKFDSTIMLIDDVKFRESRKPLTIYDIAIQALEQTRWIPVSERLPEEGEPILFSTKTGEVYEGAYFDLNENRQWYAYRDENYAWNNVVTAWLPLPQPYKAERNGAE